MHLSENSNISSSRSSSSNNSNNKLISNGSNLRIQLEFTALEWEHWAGSGIALWATAVTVATASCGYYGYP